MNTSLKKHLLFILLFTALSITTVQADSSNGMKNVIVEPRFFCNPVISQNE